MWCIRSRLLLVSVLIGTLLPGGFGNAAETGATNKPTSLTPVRYTEVIRSIFYLPSYVALAKGYFKDKGLDVQLSTAWSSDKGTSALLAGSADIALVGPETSVYIWNSESPEKVKIFCGLTAKDGSMLISRKKISQFDWKMLKGKTILSWQIGGSPDLSLKHVLRARGLDPQKDVNLINNLVATARHGAFISGTGDVGTFFEPDVSEMEKAGQAYFVESVGKAVGNIDYTVFIATNSYIRKNPQLIQAWTDAVQQAQKYSMSADPVDIAKLVAPYFPNIDEDILISSIKRYRSLGVFKTNPLVGPEAIKGLQDLLIEGRLLSPAQRVRYEDVVDPTFARKAIAVVK